MIVGRDFEQEKKLTLGGVTLATQDADDDLPTLQLKVDAIDAQLLKESARFGGVLWRTTQAQIDFEEALERKAVFSEQLRLVLVQNEASRADRIKTLFIELNSKGASAPGE